ncbi:MAG TPA: hypothetical protein VJ949_06935, partial [Cryomorphaceae bacterium]|nr:hypothetical protein [Cryomorphaceae bacterium]
MTKYLLSFGCIVFLLMSVSSQDLKLSTNIPEVLDGNVRAIAIDEEKDRIYIGGDFSELGISDARITPFLDAYDLSTSEPIIELPTVDGFLRDVIDDGEGGRFICGEFSKVGKFDRQSLAHINANNQVTALSPEIDGDVYDVHLDQERGVLYVGGFFETVNGLPRKNICAFDYNTYDVLPFNPAVNGPVRDIEQKGDTLFIGGTFSGVGEIKKLSVTYDLASNEVLEKGPFSNRAITAAVADGNGGWFIAGEFTNIKDSLRSRIAHIDENGNPTAWNASVAAISQPLNTRIFDLHLTDDGLYIAGYFHFVNGESRELLAALDPTTGELLPWNPGLQATSINEPMYRIDSYSDSILVGGIFNSIDGNFSIKNLALVDPIEGNVSTSFISQVNGAVRDIKVNGDFIHLAGDFSQVAGFETSKFATLDLANLTVISTDESLEFSGTALAVEIRGDTAFIGGSFSEFNGSGVENLCAVNWTSGDLIDWTPAVNAFVNELKIAGNRLFVGGSFTSVEEKSRPIVAAFDVNDLQLTSDGFAFSQSSNEFVRCTALEEQGGELLVASSAGQIQENIRMSFAAFDFAGEAYDLSIPFSEGTTVVTTNLQSVFDLEITGNKVYAGGNFSGVNLNGSQYFASASIITGVPDQPSALPNARVLTLAADGNKLYFAGDFTEVNEEERRFMARIDLVNEELDPGSVFIVGESVWDLEITDDELFLGGDFTKVRGVERSNIASLNKSNFQLTSFNPDPNDRVRAISVHNGIITYGGSFNSSIPQIDTVFYSNFAVIDKSTGEPLSTTVSPNGLIDEILIDGDRILISGAFSLFGDSIRHGIVALDRETLEVTEWGQNLESLIADTRIYTLKADSDRIYYTGKTNFAGNTQLNLGALNRSTGNLLDWPTVNLPLDPSDKFLSLAVSDTSIFVGGDFDIFSVDGESVIISNLLEIGQTQGELTDFRYVETPTPFGCCNRIVRANDMVVYENDLIVAGVLHAGGDGIGKVNLASGELTPLANAGLPSGGDPFNNEFYAGGLDLYISGSSLYFAAEAFAGVYSLETNQYTNVFSNEDWYEVVFDGGSLGSPRWDPVYTAFAIAADSDGDVYVGGDFEEIIDLPRKAFAVLSSSDFACQPPTAGIVASDSQTRDLCLNNGVVDQLQAEVSGNTGSNSAFILHDADYGIKVAKLNGLFQPDAFPPGDYFISHVAFNSIETANISNLNDLDGCFTISSPLPVTTFRADAGLISTQDPTTVCIDDLPVTISVDRTNSSGPNQGFALLNGFNQIVSVNTDNQVQLDGLNPGTYSIYSISTDVDVDLENIQPSNLDPCFDASAPLNIDVEICQNLMLSSNPNPVIDISMVEFTTQESGNVILELFDLTGKRIDLIYGGMAAEKTPMSFQFD